MASTHISRPQIVAAARSWLGTPYHHQGRAKGAGVDCIGLIIGVAKGLGVSQFDTLSYGRLPSGAALREGLQAHAHAAQGAWLPGQIVLLRFDAEPAHLGILGDYPGSANGLSLIHAYSHSGCVTEHRLADVWRARVVQRFEFPGLPISKAV